MDTLNVRGNDNPNAINLGITREFNLTGHLLSKALEEWPENIAIVAPGRTVTFSELNNLVNKAGNFLLKHKVRIEERVVLLFEEGVDFLALYLGCIKIGAVPVAIHKNFKLHELRYILDDTRASLAVVTADIFLEVKNICKDLAWNTQIIVDKPNSNIAGASLAEELEDMNNELNVAPTTTDDVALWIYTQGTSGFPKATVHIHRSPLYVCQAYAQNFISLNREDIILSTSPIYSNLGIMEKIFFPLCSGATVLLRENYELVEDLIDDINTHKPTVFFGDPNTYARILAQNSEDEPLEFPSLRLCISGGQTLPLSTQLIWEKHFLRNIIDGLSSTEELYTYISNSTDKVRIGSVGKPINGYLVRLENKDGQPVQPGQYGNLLVNGGSMAKEFWNKRKKSSRSILGTWLDTGDKCTIDEDGYFYFMGKKEDMIYIDGQWVSPLDVEDNLLRLPQVDQAAVVSAMDNSDRMHLRAYIVLRPNIEPSGETANAIKYAYNNNQPPYLQIKWIEFVPSLPYSINGKLQRYKLR
ncbi:benzoate-CoA ligase family protein [bacterium]|nr:benzoate-CoA ligase family protein [bacterium]